VPAFHPIAGPGPRPLLKGDLQVKTKTMTIVGLAGVAALAVVPAAQATTIRLWLNGGDTPDALVQYGISQFKTLHPNDDVQFERQQWTGIVEKLTTSLSSSDSPDVIELGNTQAQAFEAAGALDDLSPVRGSLGGSDFLRSLADAGTYKGKFYAAPYYAGARIVVYRKDLLRKSHVAVPRTLNQFVAAGIKLKQDNAKTAGFSGIYFPGKYWFAALPFIWSNGGDIAVNRNGSWVGTLSSPASQRGLAQVKTVMDKANGAPKDGDESKDYIAFCKNQVAMLPAPGWKVGQILNTTDGCPGMKNKIGVFALPGARAGSTAPVFLGGSNIAVAARSANKDLARDLVRILTGLDYQKRFAALGVIPARAAALGSVAGDAAAKTQAIAARNSRFVPTSENWASVESAQIIPDMLVTIARGGNVAKAAKKADRAIAGKLNG
jgi:N,N'-diacetylchitobiose transport system substrate-binding protein